ncbi:hypothetical protein J0J23_22600, partial [Vibrio vulnificus]|uniref:hypothetical protein n=1 Tax=Vibrio vulnificus TaxID=672 RepID=UPI0019D44127
NGTKNTFLSRLYLRDDSNAPFWKEKFLAGLPYIVGERVRNKIKKEYGNQIPYNILTYGQLTSFTQQEAIQACKHLQMHNRLNMEM